MSADRWKRIRAALQELRLSVFDRPSLTFSSSVERHDHLTPDQAFDGADRDGCAVCHRIFELVDHNGRQSIDVAMEKYDEAWDIYDKEVGP